MVAMTSGLLFIVLTLTGARELVVKMIPPQIKLGLGASIGLFIAMLGCRDAGMVSVNVKTMALVEAGYRSMDEGRAIKLSEIAI